MPSAVCFALPQLSRTPLQLIRALPPCLEFEFLADLPYYSALTLTAHVRLWP